MLKKIMQNRLDNVLSNVFDIIIFIKFRIYILI
jgi:hypothetical protein